MAFHLKGISSGEMALALEVLVGTEAGSRTGSRLRKYFLRIF
jgi:hypothetical protein